MKKKWQTKILRNKTKPSPCGPTYLGGGTSGDISIIHTVSDILKNVLHKSVDDTCLVDNVGPIHVS